MIALGLVPIGSIRLCAAFERWADLRRPTDAEILARRDAGLIEAEAEAREAGDFSRAVTLQQALHSLRVADARQRERHAALLWSSWRQAEAGDFLAYLRAGQLRARIFADGVEQEIDPGAWYSLDLSCAAALRPPVYLNAAELGAWLAAAAGGGHRERFAALVEFLRSRAGTDRPPSEGADLAAAADRFGNVTRAEIRQARAEAYPAAAIKRGRPAA